MGSFEEDVRKAIRSNDLKAFQWINEIVSSKDVADDIILEDRHAFLVDLLEAWSSSSSGSSDLRIEQSILLGKFSGLVLEIGETSDKFVSKLITLIKEDSKLETLLYCGRVFKCLSSVMTLDEISLVEDSIFMGLSSSSISSAASLNGSLLMSRLITDLFDGISEGLLKLESPFSDDHLTQLIQWSLQYDTISCTVNLSKLMFARNLKRQNISEAIEKGSFAKVLEVLHAVTFDGEEDDDDERRRSKVVPLMSYLIIWYRWLVASTGGSKLFKNAVMAYLKLDGWEFFDRLLRVLTIDCFNLSLDNNSIYWFQGVQHYDISEYYLDNDYSGSDNDNGSDSDIDSDDNASSLLACHIYWILLNEAPALVRRWTMEYGSSVSRQLVINLESWSERHFSGPLVGKQMQAILLGESSKESREGGDTTSNFSSSSNNTNTSNNSSNNTSSNTTSSNNSSNSLYPLAVTIHKYQPMRGASVEASFPIEESISMEVSLTIPSCFPLKAVTVQGGRRMGVTESVWRRWLFQTEVLMSQQNGTLLDALVLWKGKAARKFESVEDCPICYSLIHQGDKSLPGTTCKTCQHKFHSACLFKRFKSSNQSTCPLCRSYF